MAYTHSDTGTHRHAEPASFSIPSILAIVCAFASFFFGAGLGMILAIAAIVLGGIGLVAAFSPSVRGGVTSIVAIAAGVIGILAAFIRLFI
jgi:hypothetical protein